MNYENLSTPVIVAKWFDTTPHNIRKTYQHKKPKVYDAQCIASYILENGITAEELVFAKKMIDLKREYY